MQLGLITVRLLGKSICGMCEMRCLSVYLEGRPASFIYLWTLLTICLASAVHLLSADVVSAGGRYELKWNTIWADIYTIRSITACPGHLSCGVSTTATPTSWWWRRQLRWRRIFGVAQQLWLELPNLADTFSFSLFPNIRSGPSQGCGRSESAPSLLVSAGKLQRASGEFAHISSTMIAQVKHLFCAPRNIFA